MSRLILLAQLAAVGAAIFISAFAQAQTTPGAAQKSAASRTVPMHPSALTLGSQHHRGAGHHHYVRRTLHQPTPIHGTMAGPRM